MARGFPDAGIRVLHDLAERPHRGVDKPSVSRIATRTRAHHIALGNEGEEALHVGYPRGAGVWP